MYKNYDLNYVGQGNPDYVATLSVSEDLFGKVETESGCLEIGGGYNGNYLLTKRTIEFAGFDETENQDGINELGELIDEIQSHMDYDSGAFIRSRFVKILKEKVDPSEYKLHFPIQHYAGGPPIKFDEV